MPKPKERVHREWFRTVMDKRKSCPTCGSKLAPNESIWSWGEYVRGKWRTVKYFCKADWEDTPDGFFPGHPHKGIKSQLLEHANGCGCQFELVAYRGGSLPEWLTITEGEICSKQ